MVPVTSGDSEFHRRGAEAVAWFVQHRRGGGHAVDAHLTALRDVWGADVAFDYRAVADPDGGLPTLIIEIDAPPDSETSWQRMLATQSRLLDSSDDLADQMRVANPFARIVIVLAGEPADWESLAQDIRELE